MKNHLLIFLIVALILSGVGNYLQYRSAELAQRARNIEAEEFAKKQLHDLGVIEFRGLQIQHLMNDRREDSVRQVKKESVFISRISGLKSKLATSSNRLPVIQDTIIHAQDSLINVIRNSRDTLYITDNQVIDSLQRSNLELSELFKGQLKESIKLQGQVDREKKKRFSVGVGTGYGIRGADVSISVHYSIFRF